MILQAYDFLELSRRHNCVLQMGGSDQWGNIVNGIELGRRVDGKQLFALTTPLLTTSSGAKMGKTMSGAVWLNADLLSPYDYWRPRLRPSASITSGVRSRRGEKLGHSTWRIGARRRRSRDLRQETDSLKSRPFTTEDTESTEEEQDTN